MGFLDRLLGREPRTQQPPYAPEPPAPPGPGGGSHRAPSDDERAIARYRYLLRTAPPEALEQVHAEAFARLTPEQRSEVLAELSRDLPAGERPPGADPQSLARSATRAELRQPGYLEHTFSRGRFGAGAAGTGMGGSIVGSMMGTIAGVVIGSALADALFDGYGDSPEAAEAGDAGSADTSTADTSTADTGGAGADVGGADDAGGDLGGGGFEDFGGGDFGGGDF